MPALAFALVLALAGGMVSTPAHHGFGDYDATRITTKTGMVVKFVNANPHGSVVLGVEAEDCQCMQLRADLRSLEVTVTNGAKAPCPCVADGLQLTTGALRTAPPGELYSREELKP